MLVPEVSWMKAVSIIPLGIKSKYPAMELFEIYGIGSRCGK